MNTSIKQRVGCILLSILFVVCLIGSLLCALILPFLSSNGVSYADSTNGVVENNILLNSDFANLDNLISNNQNAMTIYSYSPIRFSSSSNWGYLAERHSLNFYDFTQTITFTVRIRSVSGNQVVVGARCWNSAGNSVRSFTTQSTVSQSFVNLSITYSSLDLTGASTFGFCYYCNSATSTNNICEIEWSKVEYGSTFTGYVPKDYSNYGYDQGVQDGVIQGLNEYVDNYSITSYLNTDTYISTGGYIVQDGDNTFGILNAQMVENHTRTGTEGVATIYDSLLVGVDYNIIYTQGSFPSVSSTSYNGTAGYYAVSSSLLASNGFNSYINAGTPFSLNNFSSRANTDRTSGLYRLVDLSIAFLDENANIIRFDPTQFENANYYINNNRIFSTSFQSQSIVGDSISSGQVHYYRLPFDIYGILIMSYHESTDYYHAYNMKLQFLPNSSYQDGYNAGFTAGEGNVNTQSYYDNGYNQGYQYGVIKGASEANNYTFLGVIGAMLDAPVNSLLSFLDFNLLGYNMKSFFGALIVFAFVVLIIRLVLGGK